MTSHCSLKWTKSLLPIGCVRVKVNYISVSAIEQPYFNICKCGWIEHFLCDVGSESQLEVTAGRKKYSQFHKLQYVH